MSKISWIASYPKSGSTYIRLLLASYFYTQDGSINDFQEIKNIFNINDYNIYKKIKNFPKLNQFIEDPQIITLFWEGAQRLIMQEIKYNLFIKTHNCMAEIMYKRFTSEKYTKCFIYIVRDPRSVAVSYKHHFQVTYDKAVKQLINKNLVDFDFNSKKNVPDLISSWAIHYNSWKNFTHKGNGIIIKYEDLIQNPYIFFKKVLDFLSNHMDIKINEKKLNQTIESIRFSNLQEIEKQKGFFEKPEISKIFFRKGLLDEWKSCLTAKQKYTIEVNFNKEMKELGYL